MTDDLKTRVKARLIEALKAADKDCSIQEHDGLGVQIDGWFDLDKVVDAVVAEVRRSALPA